MERFDFEVTTYSMDDDCAPDKTLKCPITSINSFEARRAILTRAHNDRKFVKQLVLVARKAMT